MAIKLISQQIRSSSAFSAYEDANDEQLVNLLKLGDDRAFETLMNRHRGIIWQVAKRYFGHLQDAEDLFQDISLSYYQNKDAYQPGSAKFSSWLYRVAVNRCLDILRSRKKISSNAPLNEEIACKTPNGEDVVSKDEMSAQLHELLNILPIQQKIALSLYYFEEQEISSISSQLSVTEGAVRALIKRGKENLRHHSHGMDF